MYTQSHSYTRKRTVLNTVYFEFAEATHSPVTQETVTSSRMQSIFASLQETRSKYCFKAAAFLNQMKTITPLVQVTERLTHTQWQENSGKQVEAKRAHFSHQWWSHFHLHGKRLFCEQHFHFHSRLCHLLTHEKWRSRQVECDATVTGWTSLTTSDHNARWQLNQTASPPAITVSEYGRGRLVLLWSHAHWFCFFYPQVTRSVAVQLQIWDSLIKQTRKYSVEGIDIFNALSLFSRWIVSLNLSDIHLNGCFVYLSHHLSTEGKKDLQLLFFSNQ